MEGGEGESESESEIFYLAKKYYTEYTQLHNYNQNGFYGWAFWEQWALLKGNNNVNSSKKAYY